MRHLTVLGLITVLAFTLGCGDNDVATKSAIKPGKRPSTSGPAPGSQPQSSGPAVGEMAPEIEGVDLEGVAFKLSDYRGKVVMLDFYGDW